MAGPPLAVAAPSTDCASASLSPSRKAKTPPRPCPCCGRRAVRPAARPGRVIRYRHLALTLPADLLLPTCSRCKHEILSFEEVPHLAATLAATYRAELTKRAAAEITRLTRWYSQRHVEASVDLAQGYLSRLLAGDGVPSAALVCLLALLAEEPSRLEELKGYWALPVLEPPSRRRKQGP